MKILKPVQSKCISYSKDIRAVSFEILLALFGVKMQEMGKLEFKMSGTIY